MGSPTCMEPYIVSVLSNSLSGILYFLQRCLSVSGFCWPPSILLTCQSGGFHVENLKKQQRESVLRFQQIAPVMQKHYDGVWYISLRLKNLIFLIGLMS